MLFTGSCWVQRLFRLLVTYTICHSAVLKKRKRSKISRNFRNMACLLNLCLLNFELNSGYFCEAANLGKVIYCGLLFLKLRHGVDLLFPVKEKENVG